MTHYKPYPAYKDSRVEWIGQVPEHWSVCKLSYRYSIELGKMLDEKRITGSHPIPYLRNKDVQWESINIADLPVMDIPPAEIDRYTIKNGDLLVCEGGDVGRAAIWRGEDSVIGYQKALHRLRAIADDRDSAHYYLHALFAAKNCGAFAEDDTKSTISHLPAEKFREYRFAFPPIGEQKVLVTVLDRETARIAALIAKKTRFIELLKEKRHAIIDHAVTKGLNSEAPIRNSGVEWLGEIPTHWEVRRMASIFREAIRPGDPALPILSISIHDGITDDEVAPEDRDRRVSQIEDRTKYKRVAPNDLAYNMMRAWQGAFGAVTVDGLVSPAYVVAEPTAAFRTAYIENLLRTPMAIEEMRRYSRGIADFRMRLYWDYFRDLKVCFPPLEEQDKILSMISRETSRIDLLTEKTQRSIDLLRKRRAAFITAAVTGQIDLRESA